MREVVANKELIACCGLYCGACKKYLAEKCPGCAGNTRATWCKTRDCCAEHHFSTCAECTLFKDPRDCKKVHNAFSMVFSVLFNSNRPACIECIRAEGPEAYAKKMADRRAMTLPRRAR